MTITSSGSVALGGTSLNISINPKSTYLHTNGDPSAVDAVAIDLTALGIAAGDVLVLEQTGDYDFGDASDTAANMIGVFSTTATLDVNSQLNRVTGAVAANSPVSGTTIPGHVTASTSSGGQTTDITEDFFIDGEINHSFTIAQVPTGAGFLFVAANDGELSGDNEDPDGDFGINIYRPMLVGIAGVGSLTITGGTEYQDAISVGVGPGSNGTLTVESAASVTIGGAPSPDGVGYTNGSLTVGYSGTGLATISGGSVVTSIANGTYSNVRIGVNTGSSGTVTVTGPGSQLIASGTENNIVVGLDGTGTLNVLAGGFVQTLGLFVGASGSGTVNVTGTGSHLVVSNDTGGYVNYVNQAGFTNFGRNSGSVATFNVTAGGVFDVRNSTTEDNPALRLGRNIGSTGIGIVDGAGSQLNITQTGSVSSNYGGPALIIGQQGDGTLTVRNSGAVNITGDQAFLVVSSAGYGNNQPPPSSQLSQSELIIQTGGVVTVDHGSVGSWAVVAGNKLFGNGAIRVSGAGSKLITQGVNDQIVIGAEGTGLLAIAAAGEVQSQVLSVGNNSTGVGTVTVNGTNSKLTLLSPNSYDALQGSARLSVGEDGNGTMTVSNSASVTVTGASAHLIVGEGYNPSSAGHTGVLSILSGGTVTVTNTDTVNQRGAIDIGASQYGNGTVLVSGAGSVLTAAGTDPNITVGNFGTGLLNVTSGGKVVSLFMTLGNENGSNGTLNISGAGSKVVLSNDTHTSGFDGDKYGGFLTVGNRTGSTGALHITTGGVLELRTTLNENSPGFQVGQQLGASGIVTVDGVGSAINVVQGTGTNGYYGGAFVSIGQRGTGTFTLSNSAQLNMSGPYGTFRVSRGNNDGEVGAPARVALSQASILSGADLTLNAVGGSYYGANVVMGARSNANGRLTIDGNGSSLTVHGDNVGTADFEKAKLVVGGQGQGDLRITNGADVVVNGGDDKRPVLAVGEGSNSIGTLSITGAGSSINVLTSNNSADGGSLIAVGRWSGSTGSMYIANGAQVINDLNATNSVTVVGRSGTYGLYGISHGSIIVDGNGNANTLLDAGQLLVVGADWDQTSATLASVGFSGGGSGSVMVRDSAIVRANIIAVGQGGTIGGNGTFDGSVTVNSGGTISPGASPGILTITGGLNLIQGKLAMEVNGLTAGTLYDQVKVNGAVALGAVTINMTTAPAFNFADNNSLVLIDGGTTLTTNLATVNVNITGEPVNLGYLIGDIGNDLIFEALNNGVGAGLVNFGPTSAVGATATINAGAGTGTGGRFDSVKFVHATGLEGTAGIDHFTIAGALGATLSGLGGSDILTGGLGADVIIGGVGNDTLDGGVGLDTASYADKAQAVIATLNGAAAVIVKVNGINEDTIKNIENLIGGSAADTFTGDAFANTFKGGLGKDILNGGAGLDTADYSDKGAAVAVTLNGATAVNVTVGGVIEDSIKNIENLIGGSGIDTFTGDALANIFRGGLGKDILNGGAGLDTADYSDKGAAVSVTLNGATAVNVTVGGVIEDSIKNFENVNGGAGNDVITGDTLANVLVGNAGLDTLNGGTNNDVLNGGLGNDTLTGGIGNDTFRFDSVLNAATNKDNITDFNVAADTMQLENAIFTLLTVPNVAITAAQFRDLSLGAQDSDDVIIYNKATGDIFYDNNGLTAGGQTVFAHVTAGTALTNLDFFVT